MLHAPMTPEQEAEAIRLCLQILDGFNRICEIVDAFLTTATPYLPSPTSRTALRRPTRRREGAQKEKPPA
jgi:hypothetical protein